MELLFVLAGLGFLGFKAVQKMSRHSEQATIQRQVFQLNEQQRQRQIAARIRELESLQNTLDGCLGCGCLSLTRCKLYNPDDQADREGPGSRWLRDARYPA